VALQQGFAPSEMGFNDQFELQKILNGPFPLGLGCSLIPGARWL
jgi:hypothetical protein